MSQVPAHYLGKYNWKPVPDGKNVSQHEKNRAVQQSWKRRDTNNMIQELLKKGQKIPLTPAQEIAGARRVI